MTHAVFDLLIVGGGINGAGIARDAAGRGSKVALVEMGDFASATSSASSKLIHGGLRYLEHYEFRLVREALQEREAMLRIAPHIVSPLTFVLPQMPGMRSPWLLRAGLFLYDHLATRTRLSASRQIDLGRHPAGQPLRSELKGGFTYADCWVDDSRLVVLNAMDARAYGADVRTRCKATSIIHDGKLWRVQVKSGDGTSAWLSARVLVNAAGPWAGDLHRQATRSNQPSPLRLIKGSHIIVPRLYDGDWAYVAQQPDKRIVFLIPYLDRFTLIGTTDVLFTGDPARVHIDGAETIYLCAAASSILRNEVRAEQIVATYSGVRPLYDDDSADPSAVTRDYVLKLETGEGHPPLLSVFGGKITTYRRLAEEAMRMLAGLVPVGKPWTASRPLPGGDIPQGDIAAYDAELLRQYPWLPMPLAHRFARSYGTLAQTVIGTAISISDLGPDLGCGLHQREVAYLVEHEMATTAEDILHRRTKLGLIGGASLFSNVEMALARIGKPAVQS